MIKNTILSALTLLLINGANAQKTTKKPLKRIKFNARFQTLFTAKSGLDANNKLGDINTNFLIRRARLKLTGNPYKNFEYKMELGLSNKDLSSPIKQGNFASNAILDAFMKWEFTPGFKLVVGQTKLPGNVERVISSQKLQFVDRSLLNATYNIDRDLGVQLHHQWNANKWVIREKIALSQGEGRNITTGNVGGAEYTGRIEVLPFGLFTNKGDYTGGDLKRESKPKLMIGYTSDFNDRATRKNGNTKGFLDSGILHSRSLTTHFLDMMFKYKGWSVMAEYGSKASDKTPITYTDTTGKKEYFTTGTGYNVQAGYLFKNNIELAARYTSITPHTDLKKNNYQMYTLGLSKYIKGHNLKIQTDISQTVTDNKNTSKLMYRLQFEFGF